MRDERGHLVRVAGPAERDPGPVDRPRVDVLVSGHRRRDLARCDGVDGDAMFGELERELFRHPAEAVLRRHVRHGPAERGVLVHGRDVHYPSAASLVDHAPGGALRAQEGAVEIDVERVCPIVERELEEWAAAARPRVVDEHVHAAECPGQLVDHVRGAGQLREVEPADLGTASARLHLAGRLACAVFVLVPGDADVVAARASATAVALPIPESEPVTIATGTPRPFPSTRGVKRGYCFASSSQDSPLTPSQ
jgi:hypothetical protein